MISTSFCDELIKISMAPETKQRIKGEAKLIGAAGAAAAGAHGVGELGRYMVEKHYGKAARKHIADKAMRGGFPAVAGLVTYLGGKALQHTRRQARKEQGLPA